jgi:O-acetyl-ADP-ribose deacetylase (regulator of RNase III)
MDNLMEYIYHITPLENFVKIVNRGIILSKNRIENERIDYVSIAYEGIQERRSTFPVPLSPYGVLHDYIPFHFAPRSPMLYCIHRGTISGCNKSQQDILYLLVKIEDIKNSDLQFVFTDGHPIVSFSVFYAKLSGNGIINKNAGLIMITIKQKGNLLEEKVQAYVNTVNCVGIMGKGIALQFKMAFPDNYKEYKKVCDDGKMHIGKMFITNDNNMFESKYIINFPTKTHWKAKSKLEHIEKGLNDLVKKINEFNIKSIVIPPLGCGLGGLDWNEVRSVIEQKLSHLEDVNIIVYAPSKSPEPKKIKVATKKPEMTAGRAALIILLKNYKEIGYQITMLEIQKLMYFLQAAGENLRLRYRKAKYGPYADNLHHVLQAIEGHYISGYGDGTKNIQINLFPNSIKLAENFISNNHNNSSRFSKVIQLIEGFETPYGLELLSTVHWTIVRENKTKLPEITNFIKDWSKRKRFLFSERHIQIAAKRLVDTNFIDDLF